MNRKLSVVPAFLPLLAIIILIFDSKTALCGAAEGIDLCICTVIPSLFPFLLFSILSTNVLIGRRIPVITYLGKLCGMPHGSESLLLIGFLGGYPTGAKAVADAYRQGCISQATAFRLLGFCSNAGPAFIFGVCYCLFTSRVALLLLWLIHIISAVIVGILLPEKSTEPHCHIQSKEIKLQDAFQKSIVVMAEICGWIILFRVLTAFLCRWFLWLLPETVTVLIIGCLELSNGVLGLQNIPSEGVRFVLCSVLLASGGLCVGMQTCSVVKNIRLDIYFLGKFLQSCICFILSMLAAHSLYGNVHKLNLLTPFVSFLLLITIVTLYRKKVVAFRIKKMYNTQKQVRELQPCCSERK